LAEGGVRSLLSEAGEASSGPASCLVMDLDGTNMLDHQV
jgi:hypothetical protein